MLVPDEARKCVVFVCYKAHSGFRLAGTAFFVSVQPAEDFQLYAVYLVTAKHVIVDAKQESIDGSVWLRVNDRSGGSFMVETPVDDWVGHPDDTSVDASVLAWAPRSDQVEYLCIPDTMTATDEIIDREDIGPGDEIFLTGLFVNHVGRNRNLPIIRIGNIALMPEERIATRHFGSIEAYLVEARSIGGLSGSPVFVHVSGIRKDTLDLGRDVFYWLGLMHGHWDMPVDTSSPDAAIADTPEKEAVNMGIAMVVPATQIVEIIDQPMFKNAREEEMKQLCESSLPAEDSTTTYEGKEVLTKDDFEQALRKVNRPNEQEDQPDEGKSET